MSSKEHDLRSRVYKFYSNHYAAGELFSVNHFILEEVSKRTDYAILQRYENNLLATRQSGSGRIPKIFTSKKIEQLRKTFDHKSGISQRQAAKQFKCSQPTINYMLKKKAIFKYRKNESHSRLN